MGRGGIEGRRNTVAMEHGEGPQVARVDGHGPSQRIT